MLTTRVSIIKDALFVKHKLFTSKVSNVIDAVTSELKQAFTNDNEFPKNIVEYIFVTHAFVAYMFKELQFSILEFIVVTYKELNEALFTDKFTPVIDVALKLIAHTFVRQACVVDKFVTDTKELALPIYVFCGLPAPPSILIHSGINA